MESLNYYSYAILMFGKDKFFIPAPEDTALKGIFEGFEAKFMFETPFGSGWWFTNKEGELEDLMKYFKEQTVPFIYVKSMEMECTRYSL